MAFVNEKLTPEQRTEFELREIKNPNPQRVGKILRTRFWTIDYNNDMCLVSAGVYREFPDEEYFVFINKSKVILFAAKMHSISEGSVEWEIYKLINEVDVSAEEMENIASSLTVFQASGRSREINTKVRVTYCIKENVDEL